MVTNFDTCHAEKAQGTLRDVINVESFLKRPHFNRDLQEGTSACLPGCAAHSKVFRRSIH